MPANMEEVLQLIYPDINALNEDERKKYDKDVAFLEKYFDKFVDTCDRYSDRKDMFTPKEYYSIILSMAKDRFDKETIISKYVSGVLEGMYGNTILAEEFDTFMDILAFERQKEEEYKDFPLDKTPISLDAVFALTEEFLEGVDESGELLREFRSLGDRGGIVIYNPEDDKRSMYNFDHIEYVFDGTVNSASTLVHEFMHHWCAIKTDEVQRNYGNYTTIREVLPIYYENAFIRFMDDKGLLQYGERPLLADRLQKDYAGDPEDCMIKFFALADKKRLGEAIDKTAIIDVLRQFSEKEQTDEEIWDVEGQKMIAFADEHYFSREVVCGFSAYRFSTALAHYTSLEPEMLKKMFRLAEHVRNGDHDSIFLHEYLKLTDKHEFEFPVVQGPDMAGCRDTYDLSGIKEIKSLPVQVIGRRVVPETNIENKNFVTRLFGRWKDKFLEKMRGDQDDR